MLKSILTSFVFAIALQAQATTYKIDSSASHVMWKGTKKLGSFHDGKISVKEGQVTLDDKGVLTGGNIVVDMKSMTNNDLKDDPKSQAKLVGHLSSEDFFHVSKYPTSNFKILSASPKGKDEVIVKGELTMIGKTNPLEVPLKIKNENGVYHANGKAVIDRTKWGLQYGSGNIFKKLTADKIINDEFELDLHIVAKSDAPAAAAAAAPAKSAPKK